MKMKTMMVNYSHRYMIQMNKILPKSITSYQNIWYKRNQSLFQNNDYMSNGRNHYKIMTK